MKIKLDENLSPGLTVTLATYGHDVHSVAQERLLSRPDSDVAAAAFSEQRMLFTLDLDFSDARRFPPGTHPGIVLFRLGTLGTQAVTRFVEQFALAADLESFSGCLVVVNHSSIRVRRPDPPVAE